jgi:hypothetical protein
MNAKQRKRKRYLANRKMRNNPADFDKCDRCQIGYPIGCVSALFSNGAYQQLCDLCALDRTNEIHGTNFATFHGEMAEEHRLMAAEHLERTGQVRPNARMASAFSK